NETRVRRDGLKKSKPSSLSRKCFGCGFPFNALAVDKIRLTVSSPRSDNCVACFILSSVKIRGLREQARQSPHQLDSTAASAVGPRDRRCYQLRSPSAQGVALTQRHGWALAIPIEDRYLKLQLHSCLLAIAEFLLR